MNEQWLGVSVEADYIIICGADEGRQSTRTVEVHCGLCSFLYGVWEEERKKTRKEEEEEAEETRRRVNVVYTDVYTGVEWRQRDLQSNEIRLFRSPGGLGRIRKDPYHKQWDLSIYSRAGKHTGFVKQGINTTAVHVIRLLLSPPKRQSDHDTVQYVPVCIRDIIYQIWVEY